VPSSLLMCEDVCYVIPYFLNKIHVNRDESQICSPVEPLSGSPHRSSFLSCQPGRLGPAWMGELKERSLRQLSTACSKQAETLSFSSLIQAGLSLRLTAHASSPHPPLCESINTIVCCCASLRVEQIRELVARFGFFSLASDGVAAVPATAAAAYDGAAVGAATCFGCGP
jgi:hypothetical protein